MLPGRINRLGRHKYDLAETEVLKMGAIYGANGAGKSNLIKSIAILSRLVTRGKFLPSILTNRFKLSKDSIAQPVYLGIEFIKNHIAFRYEVSIQDAFIIEENLYSSTKGRNDYQFVFKRKTNNEISKIEFFSKFYESEENKILESVIEKTLLKVNGNALNLFSSLENSDLTLCKTAFSWFDDDLEIVSPDTKVLALPHILDLKPKFKIFANDLIRSFSTGVSNLDIERLPIEKHSAVGKKDIEEISAKLLADPKSIAVLDDRSVVVNENGEILAKKLMLYHENDQGELVVFNPTEESDGTIRLLEYIPAIQNLIEESKVYIIDEIERSIHPLIIREIVSKFSHDQQTKGQLIFSTHESCLLDQDIFRQDEIWFVEKNDKGASELYSLSSFKEHHTLDIRKGYLNGKYGAIPFLNNLNDLNWDKYE